MGQKFINPLNAVGIVAVVTAYFLFTFHAMFTLSWIGEWEGLPEPIAVAIFVTDVTAGFFLAFRLIASIIAPIVIFIVIREAEAALAFIKT